MARRKIYLGIVSRESGVRFREVFRSDQIPTMESTGGRYAAVIGPFRTARGAEFMRRHGESNPHLQTVADAERIAKTMGPL
jgi:hypothetical protein